MRKSTLLWLILAAFCGTALFHTSQKVHDEQVKLAALNALAGKEEESLRVLNAEWSYLNQPARLEKLAKTYLNMAPLKGSQFVKVADIPLRLQKPEDADQKIEKTDTLVSAPPQVINIRKPALPILAEKHVPAAARTATNTRSFSDVMKSLHAGVE